MPKPILCLLLAGAAWAQDLAVGKILVATRKSRDADLARAVVLLARYDRQSAIGLIVNHPTNVPLSEVFPEFKSGRVKVFAGGPVTTGIRALYRSRTRPGDAVRIFADVSMISNKTLLGEMAAAGPPATRFRVYAGYTGWTGAELMNEAARGLWQVIPGDSEAVFDAHPATLWSRLIANLSLQNQKHVREVVGPGAKTGIRFENLPGCVERGQRLTHRRIGHEHPVRILAKSVFFESIVGIVECDSAHGGGPAFHDGAQVEMLIGDIDRKIAK